MIWHLYVPSGKETQVRSTHTLQDKERTPTTFSQIEKMNTHTHDKGNTRNP